jgi:hypothetical protein
VLELGFRAFDPHELLPYALAARRGLLADAGLTVRLRDLTFTPGDLPQVSCGAALVGRLQGAPLRVVLVASRHPLFWLVARSEPRPGDSRRLASYPEGSPPALFARILFPSAAHVPARDDDARLGLLLAGEVDGAIVGSGVDPAALAAAGLERVRSFAEALAVPTTGLAAPEPLLGEPALERLAAALRAALGLLRDEPEEVVRTLVERFRYGAGSAAASAPALAAAFSPDGTVPRAEAAQAVALVASALGVPAPAVDEVYAAEALS